MYTPTFFFGGSSLLHLLARHPKVVAVFGLAGTIAMLTHAAFGPQIVGGTTGYAQALEGAIANRGAGVVLVSSPSTSAPAETLAIVTETLQVCGKACGDLTPAAVMQDPVLLRDVLVIHAADAQNPE